MKVERPLFPSRGVPANSAIAGRLFFLIVAGLIARASIAHAANSLPSISAKGPEFVDASGNRVILKGCNLGNWLLIEPWMFGGCIEAKDQAHLFAKLNDRFGADQAHDLMETYRGSWIQARDFELIRSFGFNVVRLPIDYRLLQSDVAPYAMNEQGFQWLDKAVSMCEAAGIYIILDLHSAPGGQSDDQCTGEAGQNKLWGSEVNQRREADIWRAIAKRFKDRTTVAGYDLMNEPYADHKMDVKADLKKIMSDCYTAIRSTGDQHIVFFPGALGAPPSFYGNPHDAGRTNVAFTEHFYPGLFGDKVAFESHLNTLTKKLPARQKWLDEIQSPYYIGEFNPVLDSTGGTRITRAYFDAFATRGWAGTLWSYKLVKRAAGAGSNTWFCVSNAKALPKLDLNAASLDDVRQFFTSLGSLELEPNQPLRAALTTKEPELLPLNPAPAQSSVGADLLQNGSFEVAGPSPDQPANWGISGSLRRRDGQQPAHSGQSVLVCESPAEISQDLSVQPGDRYRFTIFARSSGSSGDLELCLECNMDGHSVTLNSTTIKAKERKISNQWSDFSVDGTALAKSMRARIILTHANTSTGDSPIELDDASLGQLVGK